MFFPNNKYLKTAFLFLLFTVAFIQLPLKSGICAENRFENAGFDDPKEAPKFLAYLQESLKTNNKIKIAKVTNFPLFVVINNDDSIIKNQNQFVKYFDKIFIDSVKKALLSEKSDTLFVNSSGVMIGRGEIWFAQIQEKGSDQWVTRITKINNSPYEIKD